MNEYSTLDKYLGDVEPEFRDIARKVYDLGKSIPENGGFELYTSLFFNLTKNMIENIGDELAPLAEQIQLNEITILDCDRDRLETYLKNAYLIISEACEYLLKRRINGSFSDDDIIRYAAKLYGAFALSVGVDIEAYKPIIEKIIGNGNFKGN